MPAPHRRTKLVGAILTIVATCGIATSQAVNPERAVAATTQNVRLVTVNVDFTASSAQVRADFAKYSPYADIILMQEAKNVDLHSLIDTTVWVVRQAGGHGSAEAGSAIVVRRSAARQVTNFRLRKGVDAGCGLQTRYIAIVDVQLANGSWIYPASAHLPPKRCWGPHYDAMATVVVDVLRTFPRRLVIGADWNKVVANDPNNISARTGGQHVPRSVGTHIDGFYKPKNLANNTPTQGPDIYGAHFPIHMAIAVPAGY